MRIAVIEDNEALAQGIAHRLRDRGHAVDLLHDGEDADIFLRHEGADLIVLDCNLPGCDGLEVLSRLRRRGDGTPVILLTARAETSERVAGLDAGADDYLTKPFAFSELLARIRVLLRRGKVEARTTLEIADLTLDLVSHKVKREDQEIELTGKEYSLLEYFLRNQGKVLTRTMIAEHVWDYNFDTFTNVIDVYVNHLRKKIDKNYSQKLLHTLRGVGYIMKE